MNEFYILSLVYIPHQYSRTPIDLDLSGFLKNESENSVKQSESLMATQTEVKTENKPATNK